MSQNEALTRFIDMYKYYSFDTVSDYLSKNVKWTSSFTNDEHIGIDNVRSYYAKKLLSLKNSGTKIIDYQEVIFSNEIVDLGVQKDPSTGKSTRIMCQQPNTGKCVILSQLLHGKEGVNLIDVLFHLEFDEENKIECISILADAFITRGKYKSLGKHRINEVWSKGIPQYTANDFLRGRDLLHFGIETLFNYLLSEKYQILSANDDPNSFPHVIVQKDNKKTGIYVKVDAAPNHPTLTSDIKLMMKKYSEQTGFDSAFAAMSFGSSDPERFDKGLLLKYDGTYCKFVGLEWIVKTNDFS